MAPVAGLTADALNQFKIDLIAAFLRSFNSKNPSNCEAFMVLLRLFSENITKLGDETKSQFMALLLKHIKDSVSICFNRLFALIHDFSFTVKLAKDRASQAVANDIEGH